MDTLLGPQDLTVPGTEPRPAEPDEKEEAGREVGVRGGFRPGWGSGLGNLPSAGLGSYGTGRGGESPALQQAR